MPRYRRPTRNEEEDKYYKRTMTESGADINVHVDQGNYPEYYREG